MPTSLPSAYAALGLRTGASADEARAAYRRLALLTHPDKNPGDEHAAAKFREISAAYELIIRSGDRAAEADELLKDPLAGLFGDNWARAFAEGSVDPATVLEQARARAGGSVLDGVGSHSLADAALELGLDPDDAEGMAELRAMLSGQSLGDGAAPAGGLPGGLPGGLGGMGLADGPEGSNPFKEFFDSMSEAERGPMLALFEKTFPAFLAGELAQGQMQAENALFASAAQRGALPKRAAQPPSSSSAEAQAEAEAANAEAIGAFGEGRYGAAAQALGRAIALDPSNPAFYGNRSLALERAGEWEAALEDAERALKCDAAYAPAYERKARALLGARRFAEAEAALGRALILSPGDAALEELRDEAAKGAAAAQLEIVRAGKDMLDSEQGRAGSGMLEGGLPASR